MQSPILAHLRTCDLVGAEAVLARPSVVPGASGLYGWWIAAGSIGLNGTGAAERDGLVLAYVGIAPRKPSSTGRKSRSTLRSRLRQHWRGPVATSTLRRSLAAVLKDELGLSCVRDDAGKLILEGDGERLLSAWMARWARVTWVTHQAPWTLEADLLRSDEPLPLNIQGRASAARALSQRRRALG